MPKLVSLLQVKHIKPINLSKSTQTQHHKLKTFLMKIFIISFLSSTLQEKHKKEDYLKSQELKRKRETHPGVSLPSATLPCHSFSLTGPQIEILHVSCFTLLPKQLQ